MHAVATYTRTVVVRIGVLCGCLLLPLTAAAEPHLRWEAPPGCPQIAEAKGEIARLLRKNWGDIESDLAVAVSIAAVGAEFEGRVRVGRGAERVIRDRDCGVLERAVAVVVALAIEPGGELEAAGAPMTPTAAAAGTSPSGSTSPSSSPSSSASPSSSSTSSLPSSTSTSPSPSMSTTTSTSSTVTEPAAAAAATRTTETAAEAETEVEEAEEEEVEEDAAATELEAPDLELKFAFWAAGGAIVGVLPELAPGVWAGGGVSVGSWQADLRLGYWFAQSARLEPPAPDVGGSVGLAALAVDAGPRFALGPLEVPLVAGFEVGVFVAEGENTKGNDTEFPVWLSTYLGTGLAVPWGRYFAVSLRVEGLVALLRPSFAVQPKGGESQTFFQPALFGARAFLALELRLP